MFSEIKECQNIANITDDNISVNIYDYTKDKNIKDLEFEEFFGCEYISDDFSFKLFAYVFPSDELAMKYFENATGKKNDPNPTFTDSSGATRFTRIAISENKAYAIYCNKKDKENVLDFINRHFSMNIKSINW